MKIKYLFTSYGLGECCNYDDFFFTINNEFISKNETVPFKISYC